MALVYKAQDILLNRNVAIKVLRQQFVHDEEFIRRFRREAQSAASLSHSNVVSIYDVGQEEDVHYIVMEYIEGQNLNEIIKERRRCRWTKQCGSPPRSVMRWIMPIITRLFIGTSSRITF